MIEEHAQLFDFGRALANFLLCAGDVFPVLTASGVRTVGRRDKPERTPHAVFFHLKQSFGQQRMPVAIPPVHRQFRAVQREFRFQRRNQLARLLVDRTLAAEVVVVLRDREHPLARHVASPQHIFEEGNYIVRRFGPAEGDHHDCVVIHALSVEMVYGYLRKFESVSTDFSPIIDPWVLYECAEASFHKGKTEALRCQHSAATKAPQSILHRTSELCYATGMAAQSRHKHVLRVLNFRWRWRGAEGWNVLRYDAALRPKT